MKCLGYFPVLRPTANTLLTQTKGPLEERIYGHTPSWKTKILSSRKMFHLSRDMQVPSWYLFLLLLFTSLQSPALRPTATPSHLGCPQTATSFNSTTPWSVLFFTSGPLLETLFPSVRAQAPSLLLSFPNPGLVEMAQSWVPLWILG